MNRHVGGGKAGLHFTHAQMPVSSACAQMCSVALQEALVFAELDATQNLKKMVWYIVSHFITHAALQTCLVTFSHSSLYDASYFFLRFSNSTFLKWNQCIGSCGRFPHVEQFLCKQKHQNYSLVSARSLFIECSQLASDL